MSTPGLAWDARRCACEGFPAAGVVFSAALLLCHGTAPAAIHVPGDATTVADGLALTAGADTVLVAPGLYNEDVVLPSNVTLKADGPAGSVTLSGTGSSSVVTCQGTGPQTRLEGVILRDGAGTLDGSLRFGGGLLVRSGALILKNVVLRANQADFGGGAFFEDAVIRWSGGSVEENSASIGGGMFARLGDVQLSALAIQGNSAARGGGLFGTDVTLLNIGTSQWANNQATQSGGALHLESSAAIVGFCRFEGNHAGTTGGGMHVDQGSVANVNQTVFLGNSALDRGGSVLVTCEGPAGAECATLFLNHVDLLGNQAPQGAAAGAAGAAALHIEASVAAANESVPTCLDPRATLEILCSALHENGFDTGNPCGGTIADTLLVDPYLCNLPAGDVTRCSNSPLLAPPACGAPYLGASDLGCGPCAPTQVVGTSWGRVKARYR